MRIVVIQATTQIARNQILFETTKFVLADKNWEVVNLGVQSAEPNFSYVQISVCIGLLINSGAADFVITGCSSGNGMAIACNSLPNLIAGYLPMPADAFLFGRINKGNVASLPLGLNYGWAGEINLQQTLRALFETEMNTGYPVGAAERKKAEALKLKEVKNLAQTNMTEILRGLADDFLLPILEKQDLMEFIEKNGKNQELVSFLKSIRSLR